MRDLFQKLWTAIRSGFWSKSRSVACDPARSFSNEELADALGLRRVVLVDSSLEIPDKPVSVDPRTTELRLLDSRIELVREMMLKAKGQKKKWRHHEAKWNQLLVERAKISGTL